MIGADPAAAGTHRYQSLLREVNMRILELAPEDTGEWDEVFLLCECSDATCTELLPIARDEYRAVRDYDRCFVLRDRSCAAADEEVVVEHAPYVVVVKR